MNRIKLESVAKLALFTVAIGVSQHSLAGEWSTGIFAGQAEADRLNDECRDAFFGGDVFPIEDIGFDCSGDDSSTGVGINVAYNFTDTFGIEAGYADLGEFDIGTLIFSAGGPFNFEEIDVDVKVGYLAGTASYDFANRWSITGRLGVYDADVTLKGRFFSENFDVDADVYAGASLDYAFTENWSAQVRYDNFDIDMTSVGIRYSFK